MEYNMSHENQNNLQPWKNSLEEFQGEFAGTGI